MWWNSERLDFTAVIRANVSIANDVKPRVDKFAQSMNCTFTSDHSQRRKQAKIFKSFRCHLSKRYKTRPVAIQSAVPDLTERNYDCGASILVWIMNDDEEYSSKGLPAKIEIIWNHKHDMTAHILKLLRPLKETKQQFERYFNDGHSIATEADATDAYNSAIVNIKKLQTASYSLALCINRLELHWNRRNDWVIAFRDHHSRGNFTNNFAEATVRLFKDNVLGRRKSYNAASLVDVICSEMEDMYRSRLLDFAHCGNNTPFLRFNDLLQKSAYISKEMIQVGEDGIYFVPSESDNNATYDVDTKIGFCSCKIGMFGRFCKHAAAVFKFYERSFTNRPPVTYIERHQMAVVALGPDARPPRFYRALNEKVIDDDFTGISPVEDQVQEAMDVESTSVQVFPVSTRRESINVEKAKAFTEALMRNLLDHKDNEALAKAFLQFEDKFASQCDGRPYRLATLLSTATSSIGKKTRKAGAKIPLQHFSASRRKSVTKGASVTSTGHVANVLRHKAKCGRAPTQKRRNLGEAIKANRPNAKGHK